MAELDNPYFDEVAGGVTVGSNRTAVDERHYEVTERRRDLVEEYAWGIPTTRAIETIAKHGPILEVGAGNGYWAHCLRQCDVQMIATDPHPFSTEDEWSTVWKADARDVVTDYPEHTLLMVWPTDDATWPTEALGMYEGETVIYAGEGRGGCTADGRFHQMLHEEWELDDVVDLPHYLNTRDRLEVWTSD